MYILKRYNNISIMEYKILICKWVYIFLRTKQISPGHSLKFFAHDRVYIDFWISHTKFLSFCTLKHLINLIKIRALGDIHSCYICMCKLMRIFFIFLKLMEDLMSALLYRESISTHYITPGSFSFYSILENNSIQML